MAHSPAEIVEAGYDLMAEKYLAYAAATIGDPRQRFLDELMSHLPDGSDVVDLGCGAGIPSTQALAQQHSVLGVDISASQLRLAGRHVPGAEFLKADFAELDLPSASCDAVTAFYSMTHVPRESTHNCCGVSHRGCDPVALCCSPSALEARPMGFTPSSACRCISAATGRTPTGKCC